MTAKRISRQLFIVVEGVTDAAYLSELRDTVRNNRIKIHLPKNLDGVQDPQKFVDLAWEHYVENSFRSVRTLKGKVYADDELWCVCDVDNKTHGDMLQMLALTEAKGFRLVFSNPCIELWFYLHFVQDRNILCERLKVNDKENSIRQEEMLSLVKGVWSKFHKAHRSENMHYLDTLQGLEGIAVENARYLEKLYEERCEDRLVMPGTNFYELVNRMRSF